MTFKVKDEEELTRKSEAEGRGEAEGHSRWREELRPRYRAPLAHRLATAASNMALPPQVHQLTSDRLVEGTRRHREIKDRNQPYLGQEVQVLEISL